MPNRITTIMAFTPKIVKYRLSGWIINDMKVTPAESKSPILNASQWVNCVCFIRHLINLFEKYDVKKHIARFNLPLRFYFDFFLRKVAQRFAFA